MINFKKQLEKIPENEKDRMLNQITNIVLNTTGETRSDKDKVTAISKIVDHLGRNQIYG